MYSCSGILMELSLHRCNESHTHQPILFTASHHLVAHKVAVVRTLMSRAITLSSSGVHWVEKEKKILIALKENGYPSSFIRKHLCPAMYKQGVDKGRPRMTVTQPYINGLCETVTQILTWLDIGWTLGLVFRPMSTLHHMLVHLKDPVPLNQQKGVVYSISCNKCPKVGQTGWTFRHRLVAHR